MKSLFVTLLIAAFSPSAMACLGGHIKTLAIEDREIAQVDMSTNRVKILDAKSELLSITWSPSKTEVVRLICGGIGAEVEVCDTDQGLLGLQLTADAEGTLLVDVIVDNEVVSFKPTGFRRTRSAGCGQVVQP